MSFLWYSMGWASSGAISTASLIFQIRAKTATALHYAMVFPSHLRSEAFGISLLEGAMYGKPMISSEIGTGTSYINIHGETGLVVPPSQPAAFRQAMRWLWEHPQQAEEMGRNAEARYRQLFTAEEMGRRWSELYRELLEEKASSRYVKAAR